MRHRTVGIALADTMLWAAPPGARAGGVDGAGWTRRLDPPPDADASWPSLVTTLEALRAALGSGEHALSVALLPPLVDVRLVELPPVSAEDARRLLARAPSRYFLGARGAQVIAVSQPRGGHRAAQGATFVAAAASARLLAAIERAADDAGFRLQRIVPAESAWVMAARAIWPRVGRLPLHVTAVRSARADVLHVRHASIAGLRRLSTAALESHWSSAPASGDPAPAAIAVLGDEGARERIADAAASTGARVPPPPERWRPVAEHAEVAAATFAGKARALELIPEETARRQRRRLATATTALAIAAGVLIALAGATELWGVRHELARVREERASLRPRVAVLAALRDSAELSRRQWGELTAATRDDDAADLLAAIGRALPASSHLTGFRLTSDSVVLEGIASRAADVLAAMARVPALADVRSAAPVRRDFRIAGETGERFTLSAVRAGHGAPPAEREARPRPTAAPTSASSAGAGR